MFNLFWVLRAFRVFVTRTSLIVHFLHHSRELERLQKWAKRKQLKGVFAHYSWLHQVCTRQLDIHKTCTPVAYELACFVYTLFNQLTPRRAFCAQGVAAKYRLRN